MYEVSEDAGNITVTVSSRGDHIKAVNFNIVVTDISAECEANHVYFRAYTDFVCIMQWSTLL